MQLNRKCTVLTEHSVVVVDAVSAFCWGWRPVVSIRYVKFVF